MLISIVGPSHAGKSTLLRAVLRDFPNVTPLDLDAEENRAVAIIKAAGGDPDGWEARWQRNLISLKAAEVSPKRVIADVGSGSLQTEQGRRFFVERSAQVIAVVAPWEVVLARHRGRDPEEFRRTEYSNELRRVYEIARIHVDTDVDLDGSIAVFRAAIQDMIGNAA
jgi:shikimate kinase